MKPSVLIIGHPHPEQIAFGADFSDSLSTALDLAYPVLVLNLDQEQFTEPDWQKFATELKKENPLAQKIFIVKNPQFDFLKKLSAVANIDQLLTTFDSENIEAAVERALNRQQALEENQFDSLEKREKNLERSQKRVVTINQQIEGLHKALLAVHSAESIAEIETLAYSALASALDLNWARVFLHASDHLDDQLARIQGHALYKAPLVIGAKHLGRMVFARKTTRAFTKTEEESLQQVTESVALALDRIAKLDQAETLKQQWDSTFDAISEPLCLTDEKFNVIKTNQAFLKISGHKPEDVLGENCFSVFGKHRDKSFDISTQKIPLSADAPPILLILFRDITQQKKIEKQIFESSKMAELGTIGSSIAHDINNPLGGMLNFLQLIKMDLKPDHPIHPDILEMEAAGHRCKEIVENLLSFTRRQEQSTSQPVELRQVVDQALKIIELQTRSLGIEVEITSPKTEAKVLGHFNLLSQALSHILQNAFEAVSERLSQTPGYKGHIKVTIQPNNEHLILQIADNGIGISPEHQNKILNPLFSTKLKNRNQGLGLTLAYQIVADHGGQLEIFSQPNVGTTVKISFLNV